jgi:hypothetical protein
MSYPKNRLPPRGRRAGVYVGRWLGLLAVLAALVFAAASLSLGGGGGSSAATVSNTSSKVRAAHLAPPAPRPAPRPAPLSVSGPGSTSSSWKVVALVRGQPAAWLAQRGGVTMMRFDQALVRLDLHAGSSDGGTVGFRYGDQVSPAEIHHVLAAFNGGFKLTHADVGFTSGGRVAVALKHGLASIVTYADGSTDIGRWGEGLPSAGRPVYSVLQNQSLLVDHGSPAANVECVSCWGETIGGRTVVARSGLGVTASGQLVWVAGEQLLPRELASALLRAGAVRAIELDINPDWVAAYLYVHRPGGPSAEPVVPGQLGIAGRLLEPYSRDFLAIVAR